MFLILISDRSYYSNLKSYSTKIRPSERRFATFHVCKIETTHAGVMSSYALENVQFNYEKITVITNTIEERPTYWNNDANGMHPLIPSNTSLNIFIIVLVSKLRVRLIQICVLHTLIINTHAI